MRKAKLETFLSKKLIAFVATEIVLAYMGQAEACKELAMVFLGAQGAVDAVTAFKGQRDKAEG